MQFPFPGTDLCSGEQPYSTVVVAAHYVRDKNFTTDTLICIKCGHREANTTLVVKNGACRVYCVACKHLYDIQTLFRDPSISPQLKLYAEQELNKVRGMLHESAVETARRRVQDKLDAEFIKQMELQD